MKKLIILDRDGVINEDSPDYIKSPEEWIPIPGSLEAIAALNTADYAVAIASNQSGLARGYYDRKTLDRIHGKMQQALKALGGHISGIFFCPHGPDDDCNCRKPKPGLLQQIAATYQMPLSNVPFVGDSWRDLETAMHAGAKPVLVLTGNGVKTQAKHQDALSQIPCYADLWDFSQQLLKISAE